jgi:hypothetical protein
MTDLGLQPREVEDQPDRCLAKVKTATAPAIAQV